MLFRSRYGIHFVHAGDEWYLLADQQVPEAARYDGYLQLENGVGMVRLLEEEFMEALLEKEPDKSLRRTVTVATGALAAPLLRKLAGCLAEKFPGVSVRVIAVKNSFFGERITVSGLLTGQDIAAQLKGQDLGDKLLLPCNMLRSGETVFLDDMTLEELKSALQVQVDIVKSSGQDLLDALLEKE